MLYDKDIREPLFDFLEMTYGKIRIIEEKQIGKSRADVVMVVPDALYGIEIKSDADTYVRLKGQIRDYNSFFDYNYIVVGTKHAMHIKEHVPEWWGIITVEAVEQEGDQKGHQNSYLDFYVLRVPRENPKRNIKKKLSLLWRPELVHIQELNKMPKYKEKSKLFVIEKILQTVPEEELQEQISEELFERDYHEIAGKIQAYRKENNLPAKRKKRRFRCFGAIL